MNRTIPITMDIVYNKIDATDWLITPQEVTQTSHLNAMNLILMDSKYNNVKDDRSVERKFDLLKQNMKGVREVHN